MTASGPDVPAAPAGPRGRRRRVGLVPLVVALLVLLLAEVAVGVGRSRLREPVVWPTPQLQEKFAQIGSRARDGERPDVVLVGDSMMDAGGDPTALARALPGVTAYNAAIAGETLPVIDEWTTRIVLPRLHPKVVVLGLSSSELHPRALDPSSGAGAYRRSRVVQAAEGTGDVVDRTDAFLLEHSRLYRYRGSIRQPFIQPAGPDAFVSELAPDGHNVALAGFGYLEQRGPERAAAVVKGVAATFQGYVVGTENVTILQEMIRSIRRQGARVLLVAMPVTEALVRYHPRGAADYQDGMDAFAGAAERSGATFVQPGIWPEDLFADPVHVNALGAERLTSFLAPLVEREVAQARLVPP